MWAFRSVRLGCALKSSIELVFGGPRLPRTFHHRKCSILHLVTDNAQPKLSNVTVLSNLSSYGTQRESLFLTEVLKKYGVYDSHLFFERPSRISKENLEVLSTKLKDAVSSQNVSQLVLLGREIPTDGNQLNLLRDAVKKSVGEILLNIKLHEHFTAAIDSLGKEFNQDVLATLVKTLYYNSWLMENDVDFASVGLLDKLVLGHREKMDVPLWCLYMNWRVTTKNRGNFRTLVDKFIVDVTSKCVSVRDILAVGMLLQPISEGSLQSKEATPLIQKRFSEIAWKHSSLMFDDIDVLACVCRYLHTLVDDSGYYRGQSRDFSSLVWEVIAHHMKHYQEPELSTGLGICIKQASLSMNKIYLKSYPWLFSTTFNSIQAITPKLCRLSPIMGIKLFHGMVQSRHVNVAVAEQFIKHSKMINWEDHRVKEAALAVKAMGDYGCTKPSVYKSLLQYILSPQSATQFNRHPECLITALTGFSYVQIFPHELYNVMFKGLNGRVKKTGVMKSRIHMQQLVYLDDVISDLSPSYKGERLNTDLRERGLQMVPKVFAEHRDGSPKLLSQMRTSILDTINSLPKLTDQYIAQLKPVLLLEDIVLTSMSKSVKNVVIMVLDESFFMRQYHKSRASENVSLQLIGVHRVGIARLKKRGYIVVTIGFSEYLKAINKSQLIIAKLKAAKVI